MSNNEKRTGESIPCALGEDKVCDSGASEKVSKLLPMFLEAIATRSRVEGSYFFHGSLRKSLENVAGNEKFKHNHPQLCAVLNDESYFTEEVSAAAIEALVEKGYLREVLVFDDNVNDVINLTDEDLDDEDGVDFFYEQLAISQKAKEAYDTGEIETFDEYKSKSGSVYNPSTGEEGIDPIDVVYTQLHWTDKLKPSIKYVEPDEKDLLACYEQYAPKELKEMVYEQALALTLSKK